MGRRLEVRSEFRAMWLFALFDLPVETKEDKRHYAQFRSHLQKLGFSMLQYSVYARYTASDDMAEGLRNKIRSALPPDGQVRLIAVTDHQFGKMEVFYGRKRKKTEDPPLQISFF